MRITELGDCSMVIVSDPEDPSWNNLDEIVREARVTEKPILVDSDPTQLTFYYLTASEYMYSAGMLVLYFKESIPDRFCLDKQVKVCVSVI